MKFSWQDWTENALIIQTWVSVKKLKKSSSLHTFFPRVHYCIWQHTPCTKNLTLLGFFDIGHNVYFVERLPCKNFALCFLSLDLQYLSLCISSQAFICCCKIHHGCDGLGVLHSKNSVSCIQNLHFQLLCLCVLSHVLIYCC